MIKNPGGGLGCQDFSCLLIIQLIYGYPAAKNPPG